MTELGKMTDEQVLAWGSNLPLLDTRVDVEEDYITLKSGPFYVIYGRPYRSFEILKDKAFQPDEVEYLLSLGFVKPDPNPNDHCYQRTQSNLVGTSRPTGDV
jgi:hypothetical protein